MIQETGKPFHFQIEGRGRIPKSVKRHAMISKHMGKSAQRMERLAAEEDGAGHPITALNRYFEAASLYAHAQHAILELNDEKRFLHAAMLRCYDRMRELSPYAIERVDIEWDGTTVTGYLHLLDEQPRPLVFYIPGVDQTKEMFPHPLLNQAHLRGMNVFNFDGPGQGESNMRGIKLTATNYEEAASAALSHLLERPEVDASRIGVDALSFGSHWGVRFAATDHRIKALAAPWASYCEKYHLVDEESPRYKQLFAYLTGADDEFELDAIMAEMSVRELVPSIECPTLLMAGEFDPRSPIEELYEIFDELNCPKEMWIFADLFHAVSMSKPSGGGGGVNWQQDTHEMAFDWLVDRFEGKPLANEGEVVWIEPTSGNGAYAAKPTHKRHWYEQV
jgi:pimeloyl-ACP methyl ester carboxylesterase